MQLKTAGILLIPFALFLCMGAGTPVTRPASSLSNKTIDTTQEKKALINLIEKETMAFYNKDLQQLSECWGHGSYVRHMGWWKRGGIRVVVVGWDSVFTGFKQLIANNPVQNQQKTIRRNYNFRIVENMAWCTFDGYGQDNKEPDMDMPGLTRETRIFEKQQGKWKIVYVGWLLNG
jgi:hypothetical protein